MIPRDGESLVLIEQEDFGAVCGVLDIEGESVYRILRAVNAYDDLLAACKALLPLADAFYDAGPCSPKWNHGIGATIREARAAIAKAEGTADA